MAMRRLTLPDRVKTRVKRALRAVVSHLPGGLQVALLDQVCEDIGSWAVMCRVAPQCNVLSVGVTGAYGIVHGSLFDRVVLAQYARTGNWAKRTNDLLCEFFAPGGGRYIDIGANIGLTTIPVAKNPKVQCLAFEPDPTNFRHLQLNVAVNCEHRNVDLRQLAVFSHRARLKLELAPENFGDHRIRLSDEPGCYGEENWPTVEVEAAPLDDAVEPTGGRLAVKIDTQGAEPFVFSGGSRTLLAADLIVAEWAPYQLARLGGSVTAITGFLQGWASRISIAEGESGSIPPPEPVGVAIERLLDMADRQKHDPSVYVDVIARR